LHTTNVQQQTTKQTCLTGLNPGKPGEPASETYNISMQLSASLSLLLSLQFSLIVFFPFTSIHSVLCANHPHPCPQSLSMISWAYFFVWLPQPPKHTFT